MRISDSVDGMSIAPKNPSAARAAMSGSAVGANAAATETTPKPVDADQEHAATAEPVAEAAHGDEQPGQHERVDVDDPELLAAGRRQRRARSPAARS